MKPALADSYKQCEKLVKAQSTSFFLASRTLPPHKRKAIYAIYAFCRLCDDIVDMVGDRIDSDIKCPSFGRGRRGFRHAYCSISEEKIKPGQGSQVTNHGELGSHS